MSALASMLNSAIESAERGLVPDSVIRWGIRRLCDSMRSESLDPSEIADLVEKMRASDVALVPHLANEQHYEVPPAFFGEVLGARRKYSCCHWSAQTRTLDEAEEEALAITCERARLANGQDVLELGCGWGSLTLWMAEKYPSSRITAVTNSSPQKRFIESRAAELGFENLQIVRCDMNDFEPPGRYDRIVSVEMFEHMRNWEVLLALLAPALLPDGKLFVHVFRHRSRPYLYRSDGDDWMGRHFFTGGIMPSRDLLSRFDRDLRVVITWDWNGLHYRKTAEAWLSRLDGARERVLPILEADRGAAESARWFHRWRLFFLSCAELFGYANGEEWGVSHYLLEPVERANR